MGVGVMSGTSLDGIDICCVELTGSDENDIWSHKILKAKTFPYSAEWTARLRNAPELPGCELAKLHIDFGHLIGETVSKFLQDNYIQQVQFIASHGHTVFHQPEERFTFQIGDGETIASHVNACVVTNFRAKDVALGGQGAPLSSGAEDHLYGTYNVFLNLGGFCNITIDEKGFDICPCNMLLNYVVQKHDPTLQFDPNGEISRAGSVIPDLLMELNQLTYYERSPPKSLSREWFEKEVVPLIDKSLETHAPRDVLRTAIEHITDQICLAIERNKADDDFEPVRVENSLLITGGGAFNTFLVDILKDKVEVRRMNLSVADSDDQTIKFKEAIVFAFMGLRCLLSLANVRQYVTGAERDSVCGSIHLPPGGIPISLLQTDQYTFSFKRKRSSTAGSATLQIPGNGIFAGGDNYPPMKQRTASLPAMPPGFQLSLAKARLPLLE